jgi:rubrerythrin
MSRIVALLQEGRRRELQQALFYRLLSVEAESAGDAAAAERLNELLADEQHHVSRLTARILELGERPEGAGATTQPVPPLSAWEGEARRREQDEVAWYEDAMRCVEDPATSSVLSEILDSERHHGDALAGKWMPAGPTTPKEGT